MSDLTQVGPENWDMGWLVAAVKYGLIVYSPSEGWRVTENQQLNAIRLFAEEIHQQAVADERRAYAGTCANISSLLYLLEGLEVPNPQWWLEQPPEALRLLGQAVAKQAKCNALNEMAANDKERKTSPQ